MVIGNPANRNVSPIVGSFGCQDSVVAGRTNRETLKGEPETDEAPVALRPALQAQQGVRSEAGSRHYVEAPRRSTARQHSRKACAS